MTFGPRAVPGSPTADSSTSTSRAEVDEADVVFVLEALQSGDQPSDAVDELDSLRSRSEISRRVSRAHEFDKRGKAKDITRHAQLARDTLHAHARRRVDPTS